VLEVVRQGACLPLVSGVGGPLSGTQYIRGAVWACRDRKHPAMLRGMVDWCVHMSTSFLSCLSWGAFSLTARGRRDGHPTGIACDRSASKSHSHCRASPAGYEICPFSVVHQRGAAQRHPGVLKRGTAEEVAPLSGTLWAVFAADGTGMVFPNRVVVCDVHNSGPPQGSCLHTL